MSRTTELLRSRTGIRIAVVTGAAVICSGVAVPAAATENPSGAAVTGHRIEHQMTFAERRSHALRLLAGETSWLTGLKTKVAGDDRLTADQRSAFTDRLDAALARVAAARSAVEQAGTGAELRAALDRAELPVLAYPRYVLPTLAQVKSAAEGFLAARADRLSALRDRVSGDDRLTADQKSRFAAKIDAALARIATAKDAVAAADTRAQVRAALAAAEVWPGAYPRHHRAQQHGDAVSLTNARVGAHRSVTVRRATDPAHRCDGHWGDRSGARRNGSRDSRDRAGWSGRDRQWHHSGSWDGNRDGNRDGGWDGGHHSDGNWS